MGCIFKFILNALALWGFYALGWISVAPETSVVWLGLEILLVMFLVDIVLSFVEFLVQMALIGLSCLTGGFLVLVIDGVFKYFSLYAASALLGKFAIPWILGAFWWQALLIGLVFTLITLICGPTIKYTVKQSGTRQYRY